MSSIITIASYFIIHWLNQLINRLLISTLICISHVPDIYRTHNSIRPLSQSHTMNCLCNISCLSLPSKSLSHIHSIWSYRQWTTMILARQRCRSLWCSLPLLSSVYLSVFGNALSRCIHRVLCVESLTITLCVWNLSLHCVWNLYMSFVENTKVWTSL